MSFEHILVATDGSDGSRKAAAVAGELAAALNARVTVVFVHNEDVVLSNAWGAGLPGGPAPGALSVDQIRNSLEQQARDKELSETVDALGIPEQSAEPVVLWGHPADEITKYAREHDVDLIVIGSHGRSGIREALLGSVSHAVANHAPCPVTIVR
jgi:nucleotide-binding universal stress UspA family protein